MELGLGWAEVQYVYNTQMLRLLCSPFMASLHNIILSIYSQLCHIYMCLVPSVRGNTRGRGRSLGATEEFYRAVRRYFPEGRKLLRNVGHTQ